jgi:hypothetical protein
MTEWTSAFTLIGQPLAFPHYHLVTGSSPIWCSLAILILADTVETYFDSHVDYLQKKLQKHSDLLKIKAGQFQGNFKLSDISRDLTQHGDSLAENFDREVKTFKLKVCCVCICQFIAH